ncbi:GntR family transcriptional regulator [Homoserinibacter sp. YIM 151385]|uniref:GntR family transcriptional regulator n=1 Tax=Homoserinibacter sp. YIM 151385 TaxID=2985506 RepID=UPI0022F0DC68|nr:GntR family transcriptional regulator [Homoserinibacter sp. YIM 151385]WBU38778.1 GntR family transcriptional regulator [Homoserinibacter sp. YIM 151385]
MPVPAEQGATETLRRAILGLELAPGERLSERGLETRLGASRTPIRAALMRLEGEGLTRRAGRSWEVTPIDLAELRAVLEHREALERATARLAAERAEDAALDALEAIADAHRDRDEEELDLRDGADFHLALAGLSGNRFLVDGVAGDLTRLMRTRWLEVRSAASRAHARDEHRELVAALRRRDGAAAEALAAAHIRGTRDRLLTALAEERRRIRGRGISIVDGDASERS